ncbi:hypothetical protein [Thalassospira australica]|uniref:hypothetical protein n=1 Tax=Thalassospira australica TaxID=1528106 RepID=UPI00384D37C9
MSDNEIRRHKIMKDVDKHKNESSNTNLLILFGFVLGMFAGVAVYSILEYEDKIDSPMVASTIAIAIFTAALCALQWKYSQHQKIVSRANYSVSLHDKRVETFHAARQYLLYIRFEITTDKEIRNKAQRLISTADFIFPSSAFEYLKELVQKCDDYEITSLKYNRYISRPDRTPAIEKRINHYCQRLESLDEWFNKHGTEKALREALGKHLTLPSSI